MKAATAQRPNSRSDIYSATLAPIDSRDAPFRAFDAVIVVVLFLELGFVMRLILAN
jgi:hypothetical protein